MELKIKPSHKNLFPLKAVLIKSELVLDWILAIQKMEFEMEEIKIYPVPGSKPNSVYGCFVLSDKIIDPKKALNNELCQYAGEHLYIAEKSILHPQLTKHETETLFNKGLNLMHPETGLVELTEELNIHELLQEPEMKSWFVSKPELSVFIPSVINAFHIMPVAPEDALKKMEEEVFPKREKMKDESLSLFEKAKLAFYKGMFKKGNTKDGVSEGTEKTGFLSKLERLFSSSKKSGEDNWVQRMQKDYEDLEKRNQKELDKLLDMLKNNPEEALKYAIPIDPNGSSRGGDAMKFDLSKRWGNFSLFGGSSGSGSGTIDLGDGTQALIAQYHRTAEQLIKNKEYQKAAFVYMKLLKNYHLAASTLEDGGFYKEAAVIYKDYSKNLQKAAECYEKGNMTLQAIDLYKQTNDNEKVGDLYIQLNKKQEANVYYGKTIDHHKAEHKYVKAAAVCKKKMGNHEMSQAILLEGWRVGRERVDCMSLYLGDYTDRKQLKQRIIDLQKSEVVSKNSTFFIQAIREFCEQKDEAAEVIREIAYEIIAEHHSTNLDLISELKTLNKKDTILAKDAIRFKLKRNKL